jgi:hypothetical protein
VPADFGGCIKSLRTVDSIRNAVDTELARAKIAANEVATRIHTNLAYAADHIEKSQLPDIGLLVLKAPDDFAAIVQQRLAAQVQREAEARERIRAEEAAKLQREVEAKAAAEQAEADRLERERLAEQREQERQAEIAAAALIVRQNEAAAAAQAAMPPVITDHTKPVSPVQSAIDSESTLNLRDINDRIAPLTITANGLAHLGFVHVATDKSAKLYRECDFTAICDALIKVIANAKYPAAVAA